MHDACDQRDHRAVQLRATPAVDPGDRNHGFRARRPDKGARLSFTTHAGHAVRIDHLRGQSDLAGGEGERRGSG